MDRMARHRSQSPDRGGRPRAEGQEFPRQVLLVEGCVKGEV